MTDLPQLLDQFAATNAADRTDAQLKAINEEAALRKAEVLRESELIRNGGYSDVFKAWGKELIAEAEREHKRTSSGFMVNLS